MVSPWSYDHTIAALVVDTNCNKLVTSLDPVSIAPKLVSRGLISSQQAQDVLDDRVKTRSEKNLAFLKLIKSSPSQTWFSSLLEVIGEEGTKEQLKKVLEESYRTIASERQLESSHGSQIAAIPKQDIISAATKPLQQPQKRASSQPPAEPPDKMEVWKAAIRKHHNALRTGILVSNVLPALHTLLTPVEYSRVEAKEGDVDRVDELVKILLTKDESTFDGFCSALEENGYPHWASKLKGEVSSSPQPQAKRSRPCHVWHPLENEFERVKNTFLKVLEKQQLPSLSDLKVYCSDRAASVECMQPCIMRELEAAQSYEAVVKILFHKLCKWLNFSLLEMILDYFPDPLSEVRQQLEMYKKRLKEPLQEALERCEEVYTKQAESPPTAMQKLLVRCDLEAEGITPEDIIAYRKFLSIYLKIPSHLLALVALWFGSLLLVLWIPEELTAQVVQRVEEVWRELWRRKVECIEVGDKSFDLLQRSNEEKATIIKVFKVAAGPWRDVLSPYGTRLYEEYGRHESLQLCVRKHKEAGHPSPEALGALEWLLLHHTPEVAEREGKDPLNVLLTAVFMGCCDVEEFVGAVVKCLKDDPSVQSRLNQASMEVMHDMRMMSDMSRMGPSSSAPLSEELSGYLPDDAVTKLYLKYRHLPSLQDHIAPGVKDPQHLGHEEVARVKSWFKDHLRELEEREKGSGLWLLSILVEAGVTDEELQRLHGIYGIDPYVIRKIRELSKMKMRFPHSQGDVRVLQSSFRKYLAIEPTISPDALLQSANSQRRDIFRLFFETLTERKVDLEECKSYFTGEVPPPYQLDLEQAFAPFISAGAVAMETLSTSKEGPGKRPTPASPTSSSSGDSAHSSHLSEVKKQFSLLVADMLPTVTKQIASLANHFASLPVGSTGATIFSAEQAMTAARNLPRYWSWYECAFLEEVTSYFHSKEAAMSTLLETYDAVKYMSLPECFPQGPLTANQLAPPPGYTPLRLTLPNHPEDVPMGRLWSLRDQLCSSLTLQPYALLLKGYMEGSTHIIFHISQHVTLDEDQVAAMFVVAKRAGLYPHSITTGFSTAQEVEYHLMDILPLVMRRKVKGQMEGLTVAETKMEGLY